MSTKRNLRPAVAAAAATAAGAVILSGSTVLAAADSVATGDSNFSVGVMIVGIAAGVALLGLLIATIVNASSREFELPEKASLRGVVGAANRRRQTEAPVQLDTASRDQLTGLANRRRLDKDMMAHAERRGITAVMMVDVDQFDEVEARHGARAADQLVSDIGDVLSKNVRFDDVVYRYGHKEFCILLPEATLAEGHLVAARLISVVHGHTLEDGSQATVSIGISGTHDGRVSQALSGADLALLEAKKAGRDQASTLSLA